MENTKSQSPSGRRLLYSANQFDNSIEPAVASSPEEKDPNTVYDPESKDGQADAPRQHAMKYGSNMEPEDIVAYNLFQKARAKEKRINRHWYPSVHIA